MEMTAPDRKSNRIFDLLCIAGLLALSLWHMGPSLFGGYVFASADHMMFGQPWRAEMPQGERPMTAANNAVTDGIQTFYPWRDFYRRELREGRAAMWNPYIFAGTPFAANDSSAVYYPFNFLFYRLMSTRLALAANAACHIFLSGLFMFLFLRLRRLGRPAAFLGGALFMFNGWFTVWMQMPIFHETGVWLPLMLLSVELAAQRPGAGPKIALIGGVAAGIQLLAGLLQISLYMFLLTGAYLLFRGAIALKGDAAAGRKWKGFAWWALGGALPGMAVGLIQVAKTLVLSGVSQRSAATLSAALSGAAPWDRAAALFLPDFFGNPAMGNTFFNAGQTVEMTGHCGMAALALIAMGFAAKGKRPFLIFFSLMAALSVALAFGTPLYGIFHALVPGAKMLRPNRLLYLVAACVSIAAAAGLDVFLKAAAARSDGSDRLSRKNALFSATGFLLLFAAAFLVGLEYLLDQKNMPLSVWAKNFALPMCGANLGALAVVGVLLPIRRRVSRDFLAFSFVALAICEAAFWSVRFNPHADARWLFPKTPALSYLTENAGLNRIFSPGPALLPSLNMPYGLYDARGYDSLFSKRYQDLWAAVDASVTDTPFLRYNQLESDALAHPVMDMLGVKYELVLDPPEETPAGLKTVYDGSVKIFENERALPRAFLVSDWVVEPDDKKALGLMANGKIDFRTQVLLEKEPNGPLLLNRAPGVHVPATIDLYRSDRVEISVDSENGGLLFLSDQYYAPEWRAEVGGRPAEILRANYDFRAVAVGAGPQRIAFIHKGEPEYILALSIFLPGGIFIALAGLSLKKLLV